MSTGMRYKSKLVNPGQDPASLVDRPDPASLTHVSSRLYFTGLLAIVVYDVEGLVKPLCYPKDEAAISPGLDNRWTYTMWRQIHVNQG
ncbi:hypothetical protein Q9966_005712 [Columba livia]|nr:hypothetical protein Q9966_005712 [Columba livia]